MRRSWLVCAVALLLPALAQGDEPALKTFRSGAGRFSVLLPRPVKTKTTSVATLIGGIKTTTLEGQVGTTGYVVLFADYPAGKLKGVNPELMLDAAGQGVVAQFKGKLLDEKKVTLGRQRYPGRELLVQAPDDRTWIRLRLYLAGNRVYQTLVSGEERAVKSRTAESFLASFKLTN